MINNISNTNSPSFNGSFLVRFSKNVPGVAEAFENTIGLDKFFKFENALGKKDYTLYVMKHSNDLPATNFLNKNKDSVLSLKYYPEVTKCDISSPFMKVDKYFADKNPICIESISKIKKFIDKEFASRISLIERTINNTNKRKNTEYISSIAKKFNIDVISREHNPKTLSIKLVGTQGSEILLSPPTINGNRYMFLKPKIGHGETKHLMITCDGNIIKSYNTPDEYKTFINEFKKTIEEYKAQK